MRPAHELVATLASVWNDLEEALHDDWATFSGELWLLLRKLETPSTDDRETINEILQHVRSNEKAYEILRAARGRAQDSRLKDTTARAGTVAVPQRHVVVPILYATDRAETGKNGPREMYGGNRGDGQVAWGSATVSLPDDHRIGELEAPSHWKLQFKPDSDKHVVLLSVEPLFAGFEQEATTQVASAAKPEVLVFIHGFNVSFADACRRTAQLAYDLHWSGVSVLYSWPCEESSTVLAYTVDQANITWTRPHFRRSIEFLLTSVGAQAVHVLAHSMGNRALAEMLDDFDPSDLPANSAELSQIVFAAPDIDTGTFQELVENFEGRAERFTLYASENDLALRLSKRIHKYGRAGSSAGASTIDAIDASAVDTDLMAHSYFGDSRTVISDLFYLINHGLPPSDRHGLTLVTGTDDTVPYWRFRS